MVRVGVADRQAMVAIRCTTYNHVSYLRKTLDGFISQRTKFPFIAIVHDDASTDGTTEIVKEYACKYPDIIKPIYEIENQYSKRDGSIMRIMNNAIDKVNPKYVAFCEGDDYWTDPYKLQKQFDLLETHKDCTIALNRVQVIDKDGKSLSDTIPPVDQMCKSIISLNDLIDVEFYKGYWALHTSSFFVRKEMLEKYYSLRCTLYKNFPYSDMPLLLTCLLNGNGCMIHDVMGCYRAMSGGYNSSLAVNPQKAIKDFQSVANAYRDFDKYTSYSYHKQIERAARRYEWRALCVMHKKIGFWSFVPRYLPFLSIRSVIKMILPSFVISLVKRKKIN